MSDGANFWSDRRVLLTGAHGFLGTYLREKLSMFSPRELLTPAREELDLLDQSEVSAYLGRHKPTLVIHAAATVGGIGANQANPGRFFYENAAMGLHLIEESRLAGVEKFVCIGTTCAYPKFAPLPFREDDLWNGYPEETNAPYGLAKRMLLVQLQAYRTEYGFNGIYLIPANLYGPGDDFDLQRGHVIASMILKFTEAVRTGAKEVVLWGDGSPTREFLYVQDAADGVVLAAERYDSSDPVNLGSGEEVTIRELAGLIASKIGFAGKITWNSARPNGQPRRRLDSSRARAALSFSPPTSLEAGLGHTIDWYLKKFALGFSQGETERIFG